LQGLTLCQAVNTWETTLAIRNLTQGQALHAAEHQIFRRIEIFMEECAYFRILTQAVPFRMTQAQMFANAPKPVEPHFLIYDKTHSHVFP
jgi:hypothetical protein